MNIETTFGGVVESNALPSYFDSLVNHFFKILPMREQNEKTLQTYIRSFQLELIGCNSCFVPIRDMPEFITLISILQYFIDTPDCDVRVIKREVFRAISICNALRTRLIKEESSCEQLG